MTVSRNNVHGIESPSDSPLNHGKQSNGTRKISDESKPRLNGTGNGYANGHALVSNAIRRIWIVIGFKLQIPMYPAD